jgi:hypothetical protein
MSVKYICRHCERTYKRKNYYEKHILLCDLNNLSKKDKEIRLQELDDTPSLRTMYEMLLELADRNKHLETQLEQLNKFVNIKKKSLSIVDWLNNKYNTNNKILDFYEMIDLFKIEEKHLNYIFNSNYITGIKTIFEELFIIDNINNIPIKAFEQKENILFIYKKKIWYQMTNSDFQEFINIISKKIMNLFIKWQNTNINKLSDEDFSIKYTKNVQKIMGGNLSNYEICNKIKIKLYKHLKVNIKNIIEIDIN